MVLDCPNGAPLASFLVLALVTSVHPGGRLRRAVAAALLAAPLLPAAASFSAPPAAADQISATRQQIASLETAVVAGAQRIHQLTAAYAQATFQSQALGQEVSAAKAEVQSLQAQTNQVSSRLRQQAIDSYTGAYRGVPSVLPSGQGPDLAVRAEYVSVASGDLKDSVDRYRTTRRELAAAQSQLAGQQAQSASAQAAVAQARDAAIAEASSDQARLDGLQAQLTSLVAAQAQQQARAAAAAAAAAGQAKPAMQGLPVNGGLVAVVRATITPPPPAPVPSPPTTLPAAPSVAPAPPSTAPSAAPAGGDGGAGGVWLQLRQCESGDDYQANTGNGYFGAYQFSQQTWTDLGYPGRPDQESPAMQDAAAQKLQAQSGWGQWPACSAALGLS